MVALDFSSRPLQSRIHNRRPSASMRPRKLSSASSIRTKSTGPRTRRKPHRLSELDPSRAPGVSVAPERHAALCGTLQAGSVRHATRRLRPARYTPSPSGTLHRWAPCGTQHAGLVVARITAGCEQRYTPSSEPRAAPLGTEWYATHGASRSLVSTG